jgi:hypothetical protein
MYREVEGDRKGKGEGGKGFWKEMKCVRKGSVLIYNF